MLVTMIDSGLSFQIQAPSKQHSSGFMVPFFFNLKNYLAAKSSQVPSTHTLVPPSL